MDSWIFDELEMIDGGSLLSVANAISWGALGPQMFGTGATYHMVPISLAIGVFLPFPFYIMVSSIFIHSQDDMLTEHNLASNLA